MIQKVSLHNIAVAYLGCLKQLPKELLLFQKEQEKLDKLLKKTPVADVFTQGKKGVLVDQIKLKKMGFEKIEWVSSAPFMMALEYKTLYLSITNLSRLIKHRFCKTKALLEKTLNTFLYHEHVHWFQNTARYTYLDVGHYLFKPGQAMSKQKYEQLNKQMANLHKTFVEGMFFRFFPKLYLALFYRKPSMQQCQELKAGLYLNLQELQAYYHQINKMSGLPMQVKILQKFYRYKHQYDIIAQKLEKNNVKPIG